MQFLRTALDVLRSLRLIATTYYSTIYCNVLFALNGVKFGAQLRVRGLPIIYIHRAGRMSIGSRCRFNSGYRNNFVGGEQRVAIQVLPGGCLTLGDGVAISNTTLVCANSISIEDDVFIGGGCHIYDTDFHSLEANERVSKLNERIKSGAIRIKKYAFIGAHSTILRGVDIGECSIVAAGSTVVKSIPDYELWGGTPAKFLRKLTTKEIDISEGIIAAQ
jgi:acetyltransferase-like isoleucine patch superfamily enzyme